MSRDQLFHCGIIWQRNYSFFQLYHHSTAKTLSFPFRFMIFFPFHPHFILVSFPHLYTIQSHYDTYRPYSLFSPYCPYRLYSPYSPTALPQTPFYNSHYSTIEIVFPRKSQQTLQCYLYTTTEEFCLCRNNSL